MTEATGADCSENSSGRRADGRDDPPGRPNAGNAPTWHTPRTARSAVPSVARRIRSRGAFLLLETMIGVAIFAIGVIALGRCVQQLLQAEAYKNQDQVAKLALENRMAEVEAGAVSIEDDTQPDHLKGMYSAITLRQSRKPARLHNEYDEELVGVYLVRLEALWHAPEGDQEKELTFYVYRPQQ